MKEIYHDLNHELAFSAQTINCVCHSIRPMFRVSTMYNFDRSYGFKRVHSTMGNPVHRRRTGGYFTLLCLLKPQLSANQTKCLLQSTYYVCSSSTDWAPTHRLVWDDQKNLSKPLENFNFLVTPFHFDIVSTDLPAQLDNISKTYK